MRTLLVTVLTMLAAAWLPVIAAEPQKVTIDPAAAFIQGPGNQHSVIVSARYADGSVRDVTREAMYKLSDPGIVSQGEPGVFKGLAEGVVKITATLGARSADCAVIVSPARSKSWEFASDIAPIFSKFGCNGSNCHGALNGQGNFKLSLFGYDADADYEAVVKKSNGRRLDVMAPEKSLLVQKPIFATPHGGGKRMEQDTLEYTTLIQWIKEGGPKGTGRSVRLNAIQVFPADLRVLANKGDQQQFFVQGHYEDGSRADLTRAVQYVSSDEAVLTVSPSGLATAKGNGEVTILVRTLGRVGAARVAVALNPSPLPATAVERRNFIDELIFDKLAKLRIEPSPRSSDAQFLRRVFLDAIGTLPTEKEVLDFEKDTNPAKRDLVIDSLLARAEFAQFWAQKWGDLFMMAPLYVHDNSLYSHEYFRRNFAADKPYNEVAREMVTGLGTMAEVGPNNFYTRANRRTIEEYSTFVSQTLLGVSLECARCHDHPRERWTRDDFLGIAAFFSQVKIKEGVSYRPFEGLVSLDYTAEFKHPQTLQIIRPRLLNGVEPALRPMVDRREVLAGWVTSPDNPFFAKATVNRVWKQLMGRGLVDPVDDFRATNPPSHPELLERLAAYFVEHGFRMKPVMATILKSTAYQLSAATNESNHEDSINYSHYFIRRLTAEQLLDAVSAATGVPEKFRGFYRGKKAVDLPDSGVPSYFLDTFDRPIRDVAKCERKTTTTITQAMHFLSGETLNLKISSPHGALAELISTGTGDDEIVRKLYVASLGRSPDHAEMDASRQFVAKQASREKGLQGVLWALLNSKEFLFNH